MANEWIRKDMSGGTVATAITGGAISGVALAITVVDGSTYPDGSAGKFVIVIDRGLVTEEKILITSRAANVLTVSDRGYDGTAAQGHVNGAVVEHCIDGYSVEQALAYAAAAAAVGSMSYRSAAFAYLELLLGAAGKVLRSDGAVPSWGVLTDVQLFTATGAGVWTKPAGTTATSVTKIIAIGGGGGGSSGGRSTTDAAGGSGGGGGERVVVELQTSLLSATEATTVGAGGAGGAAQGTDANPGLVGVDGGSSGVGTKVVARGGKGGPVGFNNVLGANGGRSGIGVQRFKGYAASVGTSTGGGAGGASNDTNVGGIPGEDGNASVAGGGAAGCAIQAGVAGTATLSIGGSCATSAGGIGGLINAAGQPAVATLASVPQCGGGGGGASSSVTVNGPAGGAGAIYGGGGGGGGAVSNGRPSGPGGGGAQGILLVVTYI